jgi:hypothetical protein
MPGDRKPLNSPKEILQTLKDWKELVGYIAVGSTTILGVLFGSNRQYTRIISWVLAGAFVGIGVFVWYRIRKRQLQRELSNQQLRLSLQENPRAALRGLAAFEEKDELPGSDRRVEARSISTQIASDDFGFGVLCGDTGCGKTSMLRTEISRVLKQSGFEVAYVRNYRRTQSDSQKSRPIDRLNAELNSITNTYIKPTTSILIFDQFEELLNEYPETDCRTIIGYFIQDLTKRSKRLRVIVAIRPEFLVDIHELTDELGESLSGRNIFRIKHFRVEQARNIIQQCGQKDGIVLDETFAKIVAQDLAEDGYVRPTELQIVCTSLAVRGSLNTSEYRRAGGTAGILAHYIRDAIDSSKSPDVGAKVLRALCDFPARQKRKSSTVHDLVIELESSFSTTRPKLEQIIQELSQHFSSSRILIEEAQPDGEIAFALMHDYLVDAVRLATKDSSTKTEEANQLLKYYVAERTSIPIRRVRFIMKFAEPPYLREPHARRLIRKSILTPIFRWGTMAIVALTVTGALYAIASTETVWSLEVVNRHWVDANAGGTVNIAEFSNRSVVTNGGATVRVWDSETANLLQTFDKNGLPSMLVGTVGKFAVLSSEDLRLDPRIRLLNLLTGETVDFTVPHDTFVMQFTPDETWLSWVAGDTTPGSLLSVSAISLIEQKQQRKLTSLRYPRKLLANSGLYATSNLGHRIVALTSMNDHDQVLLLDTLSGEPLATLADSTVGSIQSFSVNDQTSRICTASLTHANVLAVQVWDLGDGTLLNETRISLAQFGIDPRTGFFVKFNKSGSVLRVYRNSARPEPPLLVLVTSSLELRKSNPVFGKKLLIRTDEQEIVSWKDSDGTKVWDTSQEQPLIVRELKIDKDDGCIINRDYTRAAILSLQSGNLYLYRLPGWERIAKLEHLNPALFLKFTLDERGIMLFEEGDYWSLFDAATGTPIIRAAALGRIQSMQFNPAAGRL